MKKDNVKRLWGEGFGIGVGRGQTTRENRKVWGIGVGGGLGTEGRGGRVLTLDLETIIYDVFKTAWTVRQ